MKPLNTFLIILSALWVFGGTWLLSGWVCGAGSASPMFSVKDGSFTTKSNDIYHFATNTAAASFTQTNDVALKSIANHLKKNPTRKLTLEGVSSSNEVYKKGDLGLERANAVKKRLVFFKAPEENIVTTSTIRDNHEFFDAKKKEIYGGVNFLFSDLENGMGSNLIAPLDSDEGTATTSGNASENAYTLYYKTPDFDMSNDIELNNFLAKATEYIKNNPDGKIKINGYTDNTLSSSKSKTLSDDWSRKVREFFIAGGLKRQNFSGRGHGAANLSDDPGELMNNRVEIIIPE